MSWWVPLVEFSITVSLGVDVTEFWIFWCSILPIFVWLPPPSRWDYGYQSAAMGDRTVIVDNNTWNNTHIATVGLVRWIGTKDELGQEMNWDREYFGDMCRWLNYWESHFEFITPSSYFLIYSYIFGPRLLHPQRRRPIKFSSGSMLTMYL